MPNENAVVSMTVRFEPPVEALTDEVVRSEPGLAIVLDDERRATLDPADARSPGFAQVLDGLHRRELPVYVEIDPETSAITRLLIPHVTRVLGIRPIDDGVYSVELWASHARHVLRRAAEFFEELDETVRDALRTGSPVIVTEDDAHTIIDVRPYQQRAGGSPIPFEPRPQPPQQRAWPRSWIDQLRRIWWWCCWPWWWWLRCISPARAQQVFDAMSATSCDPRTVPPPCIPFLYPDDGCWARAHEMCRLMIATGLAPRKVWIQGSLHVATRNNPNCAVWWGWHVAPTLCVRGRWLFQTTEMVIDPSLFTAPVSKPTWKGVQGDPNATLTDSDASDYLWGETDPTYAKTDDRLAYYRLQLQNRTVQFGPPPYANCP
jgi:hypothetical protein